ncbi:MAG TPA: ROK family protein, partial [Trueperaceae bacterium]|nr:ROK family protein [Trueperaceae bacterium]
MKTLGIDLGGTKIAIGIVENGQILAQKQTPTPQEGYEQVLESILGVS